MLEQNTLPSAVGPRLGTITSVELINIVSQIAVTLSRRVPPLLPPPTAAWPALETLQRLAVDLADSAYSTQPTRWVRRRTRESMGGIISVATGRPPRKMQYAVFAEGN